MQLGSVGDHLAPAPKQTGERRQIELDALRGLAACVVVSAHFFGVPNSRPLWLVNLAYYTPGYVLLCGTQAVVLFFVLSGFVLALPYTQGTGDTYLVFTIKRIFRIYIPYLVVLAFAVLGAYYFHGPKEGCSLWINIQWSMPVDPKLVIQHVLFLGDFNTREFNSPIWSLVEEMRISLLFPLFCPFVLRLPTIAAWTLIPVLSLIEHFLRILALYPSNLYLLHHIAMFVLGILLAKNRKLLRTWINSQSTLGSIVLTIVALACLRFSLHYFTINLLVENWFMEPAAAIFILFGLGENSFSRFMRFSIPQFLGRISYSIYLVHLPILLLLLSTIYKFVPLPWLLLPFILLTLLISTLNYRFVEFPSMQFGRRIARRLSAAVGKPDKVVASS